MSVNYSLVQMKNPQKPTGCDLLSKLYLCPNSNSSLAPLARAEVL